VSSAAGELVFGSVVVESSSNCDDNLVPGAASVDVLWSWTVASKGAIRRGLDQAVSRAGRIRRRRILGGGRGAEEQLLRRRDPECRA